MALIKTIETPQGIEAEYHNISVYKNTADGYLEITVNSYVSKKKRLEGRQPVQRENMLVPKDFWQGKDAAVKLETAGYNYLMTLDKFKGAEND